MKARNVRFTGLTVLTVLAVVWLNAIGLGQSDEVDEQVVSVVSELAASGHCVAHELSVPGQTLHLSGSTLHLSGSVGGLVLGPIEYEDPTGGVAPFTVAPLSVMDVLGTSQMASILRSQAGDLTEDALIVVADDFGGEVFMLPRGLFELSDPATELERLEDMYVQGQLSHGALVMHHTNALIAATEAYDLIDRSADHSRWVWQQSGTSALLVVGAIDLSIQEVEGEGLNFSDQQALIEVAEVFEGLTTSLVALVDEVESDLGADFEAVVANLSWVFLPCETVQAFLGAFRNKPFADYLLGLGIPEDASLEDFIELAAQPVSGFKLDELVSLFTGEGSEEVEPILSQSSLAFVAAAGNIAAVDYQMLPAGWSQVVGTGVASDPAPPYRYSNAADVTVTGEWVALQDVDTSGAFGVATELSYAGTSFAAPLASIYVALDLAGDKLCSSGYPGISDLVTVDPSGGKVPFSTPANAPLSGQVGVCP